MYDSDGDCDISGLCAATGCSSRPPRRYGKVSVMCPEHWEQVPQDIRDAVWKAWLKWMQVGLDDYSLRGVFLFHRARAVWHVAVIEQHISLEEAAYSERQLRARTPGLETPPTPSRPKGQKPVIRLRLR